MKEITPSKHLLLDTNKPHTDSQIVETYPVYNARGTSYHIQSGESHNVNGSNNNDGVFSSSSLTLHPLMGNTPLNNHLIQERVNLLLKTKDLVLQNKMEIKKVLRKFTEEYTELKLTEEFLEKEIEIWSNKMTETNTYDGESVPQSSKESIDEDVATLAILFDESGNKLENKESLSVMSLSKVKKRERFKAHLKMFGYLSPFHQLPEKENGN
ncbi:unnamed protein product [Ambrosiozyma monospora]|uniref:Unnamed protein product n=1 Tax=Ambrosiozyma monospora TaxID=43982 RepID=A0ACB5TAV7_AMBMO|nr:unnamed protein product [Ambrosiozyma monospora]